jgi:hypothetical protein
MSKDQQLDASGYTLGTGTDEWEEEGFCLGEIELLIGWRKKDWSKLIFARILHFPIAVTPYWEKRFLFC